MTSVNLFGLRVTLQFALDEGNNLFYKRSLPDLSSCTMQRMCVNLIFRADKASGSAIDAAEKDYSGVRETLCRPAELVLLTLFCACG